MGSDLIQIEDYYKLKKINKVLFSSDKKIIFEEQKVLKKKNDYSTAFYLIDENNKAR